MEHSYSVVIGSKHVGKVLVLRNGLYYHFSCRCHLTDTAIYRLVVTCGTVRTNLGILVPEGNGFVLNTKIPVKRIGEGELSFLLIPKQESYGNIFAPICPEEPFAYISRLKESFLTQRNGQPGILIEKMQEP